MGTNYYVRKAIRPSAIKKLKDLVNERDIYDGVLQEALDEYKEIHIGKSSAGWQFCFDHNNGKYYKKTYESINSFLRNVIKEGGHLVTEYGEDVSVDDFWNMVRAKKEGFDANTYYLRESEIYKDYLRHPEKYKEVNLKPAHPFIDLYDKETFSQDEWHLRFSDATDFC